MSLSADEYQVALSHKEAGNKLFKAGELAGALREWDACLSAYGGLPGSAEQRLEKAKVCSNKAEAYLKLERHAEAREASGLALELDERNQKARFRRARACLRLGGWDDLLMASEDVKRIQADGGTIGAAEAALFKTAEGKLLLSKLGKPSAPVDHSAAQEDARERAAATVAALAPELERAAALAAAGVAGTERVGCNADGDAPASERATSHDGAPSVGGGHALPLDVEDAEGAEDAEERALLARRREARVEQLKREQASRAAAADPRTRAWAALLRDHPPSERYAWLVDVYRTHVDAEARAEAAAAAARRAAAADGRAAPSPPVLPAYMLKGGPRASRLAILSDFLVFCKACAARGLCTLGDEGEWQWAALLSAAGGMLHKGFHPEACGASHRYGPRAAGDAMRAVGAAVYGGVAVHGGAEGRAPAGPESERIDELRRHVYSTCWGDDATDGQGATLHRFSFESGAEAGVFDDVGGVQLWRSLNETLKATRLG